jgi:hypothetical protein
MIGGKENDELMRRSISTRENEVRLMLERIDHNTKYHPLDEDRRVKQELVRDAARRCMRGIVTLCPASRETSLALTKVEEAMMWANAAIAREQK